MSATLGRSTMLRGRPFTAGPAPAVRTSGLRSVKAFMMDPKAMQAAMQDPAVQEQMKKMMQDPAFMERMKVMQQQMMKPEVQQQMAQMQAAMQNQAMQERLAALKDDPEMKEMMEDLQKGGMQALAKYWNDPKWLAKLSSKVGTAAPIPAGAAPPGMAPPAPPEIKDLLDAAKFGDMEAVEDFLAIGKDVNTADGEKRTPLHFACGYGHRDVAKLLLESGADMSVTDSMANTPLHYAAGYGRPELVALLLDAKASTSAQNIKGKTPVDLVKQNPQNPVAADAELMKRLGE